MLNAELWFMRLTRIEGSSCIEELRYPDREWKKGKVILNASSKKTAINL
jgi:hypothetical protein